MSLFPASLIQATDNDGNPVNGAKWWFYLTGTSTPATVYSNATLATSLGATVTADSAGWFVPIYYDDNVLCRAVLKTPAGATIGGHDIDPINGTIGGASISFLQAGTGAVTRTMLAKARESVTAQDFGAIGDGTTDDRAAFVTADAALPANAGIRLIARHYIASNLTITRALEFAPGGRIVVPNGVTVTVNAPITAGLYRIFELTGTGSVVLNLNYNRNSYPEWWYDASGDWKTALEQAVLNGHEITLQRADYYTTTWKVLSSNKRIRGTGANDYTGAQGTRVISLSATADIMQVGPDTTPGGNPGSNFQHDVHVSGIQLLRATTITPNASVTASPVGLRAQFLYECRFENVHSWESSIGFYIGGTVTCRFRECFGKRSSNASTTVNDIAYGYYLDGAVNIGLAGGNASLYMIDCIADINNSTLTTPVAQRIGIMGNSALVDTFLIRPETVNCGTGIKYVGTSTGGASTSNVDMHIEMAVVDQPAERGIHIENLSHGGMIDIFKPYVSMPAAGIACMYFAGPASATITMIGGQLLSTLPSTGDCIGIYVNGQKGVNAVGMKFTNIERPVLMNNAVGCDIQGHANLRTGPGSDAVALSGTCDSCSINVSADAAGGANSYSYGVQLYGSACTNIRIDATRIQASAVTTAKVRINGRNLLFANSYTSAGYIVNSITTVGSIDVVGLPKIVAATLGDNNISTDRSVWNSATPSTWGPWTFTNSAAPTAIAAPLTTNYGTMQPRVVFTTTAAANVSIERYTATQISSRRGVGGGFYWVGRFHNPAAAGLLGDSRFLMGLYGTTGAIAAGTNPSALLHMFGFGKDTGDTNYTIMSNDGTGAATKTTLTNTGTATGIAGDTFEIELWALPADTVINYRVSRWDENFVISVDEGSISADLPAIDTLFTTRFYISTGATATATAVHYIHQTIETV